MALVRTPLFAALAQAGLAIVVLIACVVAPRPGGAALLVPIAGRVTVDRGLTVLRAGAIPGSVLVRGPVSVGALLRRGIVPLGAPDWLCAR